MNKKEVFLWVGFFLVWLILMGSLFTTPVKSQGLTSLNVYDKFMSQMRQDKIIFPDAEAYQIINGATEMACAFGLAYQVTDTLVLATGVDEIGLKKLAIWVYRVGRLDEGYPSWKHIDLANIGKYGMIEALNPAFFDFVTVLVGVTTTFGAGGDTSYLEIAPKPTSGDSGDSIVVCYFAWDDTINANLKVAYQDVVLKLALMDGYIRKGRTDLAVNQWNQASITMNLQINARLKEIYDIEIVPKNVGGR